MTDVQQKLGAAVMLCALVLVAIGLFHGIATGDIKTELLTLATGSLLFYCGWDVAKRK